MVESRQDCPASGPYTACMRTMMARTGGSDLSGVRTFVLSHFVCTRSSKLRTVLCISSRVL